MPQDVLLGVFPCAVESHSHQRHSGTARKKLAAHHEWELASLSGQRYSQIVEERKEFVGLLGRREGDNDDAVVANSQTAQAAFFARKSSARMIRRWLRIAEDEESEEGILSCLSGGHRAEAWCTRHRSWGIVCGQSPDRSCSDSCRTSKPSGNVHAGAAGELKVQ